MLLLPTIGSASAESYHLLQPPPRISNGSSHHVVDFRQSERSRVGAISGATSLPASSFRTFTPPKLVGWNAVYDTQNGYVYVVSSGPYGTYGNVSVLNGASIVRTIGVGGGADPPIYDPQNGFVYIQNTADGNVSILNGTTLVATVGVGWSDFANAVTGVDWGAYVPVAGYPAYDPDNGFVYVPNSVSDNVSVLNGTQVVATIPVGSVPLYANFDPMNGYMYITNDNNNCYPGECNDVGNVTVLNGTSVVGTAGVGLFPSEPTIGANGYLYVPNAGSCDPYSYVAGCDSANVTVINGTTVVANVSVGSGPFQAVSDPRNGFVYVSHAGAWASDNLTVINGTSVLAQVGVPGIEGSESYDAADGSVYLGVWDSSTTYSFTVVNGTSVVNSVGLSRAPYNTAYNPDNGCVYSLSGSVEIVCQEGLFNVSFSPEGLPPDTTWSVTLENTTESGSGNLSFSSIATGSYSYVLGTVPGYHSDVTTGNLILGTSAFQPVPFYLNPPPTFAVTFTEAGLPTGTEWGVTLAGEKAQSSTPSLPFLVPNGTYPFSIKGIPGWTARSFEGNVSVRGTPVSVQISWERVVYPVTFQESGLNSGTQWEVGLNSSFQNSSTASVAFDLTNGTYNFTVVSEICYRVNLSAAEVNVSGAPVFVLVGFKWTNACGPYFGVVFVETGLPDGMAWTVTLNGNTEGSTPVGVVFAELNGTYNFSVGRVAGFITVGTVGRVTVSGQTQIVPIAFRSTASKYVVTFSEAGLDYGTFWAVALGESANWSSGTQATFDELNGTYPFTISSQTGYSASPSQGNVTVDGANVIQLVTFRSVLTSPPNSETPAPRFLGLPGEIGYLIVGGVILAVVLASAALFFEIRGRRFRPPSTGLG